MCCRCWRLLRGQECSLNTFFPLGKLPDSSVIHRFYLPSLKLFVSLSGSLTWERSLSEPLLSSPLRPAQQMPPALRPVRPHSRLWEKPRVPVTLPCCEWWLWEDGPPGRGRADPARGGQGQRWGRIPGDLTLGSMSPQGVARAPGYTVAAGSSEQTREGQSLKGWGAVGGTVAGTEAGNPEGK